MVLVYDPEECWGNVGPYDLVTVDDVVYIVDTRLNTVVDTVESLSDALVEAQRQCNFDDQLGRY